MQGDDEEHNVPSNDNARPHHHLHYEDDEIEIVGGINYEFLPGLCKVMNEAFGSKRTLFIFPGTESLAELKSRYRSMPASKRALGAVALERSTRHVLGAVQMAAHGMPVYPLNIHTCTPDEMYIETVAVSASARGKGIGKMLLEWCEQKARSYTEETTSSISPSRERIQVLTLEVLLGNRAVGLYERYGFEQVKIKNDCCSSFVVCCLLGRPYGCRNPEWGSVFMEKRL